MQDPTAKFFVGFVADALRIWATPFYYAGRSQMGVQYSGTMPLLIPALIYGAAGSSLALTSPINARVVAIYFVLVVVGYFRNASQAKRRRQTRDWNVHSWSSGESLLEPVLILLCRRVYRRWGNARRNVRLVRSLLDVDFIYYFAEPAVLVAAALALYAIGSTLFPYPLLLAITLIFIRNDAKLRLYLRAHEIADGKMFERSIMGEFQGDGGKNGNAGLRLAQIPQVPHKRVATDQQSVFDRLSPELQLLLMRDRTANP